MEALAKKAERLPTIKGENSYIKTWLGGETYTLLIKIRDFKVGDVTFPGVEKLERGREGFFQVSKKNWNLNDPEIREYFNNPAGLLADIHNKTLVLCINGYTAPDENSPDYNPGKIPGVFEIAFIRCISI